ncbi:hypothetical protein BOTBODRAFT_36616 [Botryobasidium botryosum FD-172 SS1]|uniref:Uncharacterized protein n=1 Tax=Botryobasidium botryosum (strain FD-172 SS1) TaxID=930990 RepID=A0A067LQJ7_BOTB1|nr:hypothetical protein BOTBODRAFT_40038 [Botryobasidium botryosum FD-172 SS1]KDQ09998.1 hypothetical protein BOTBODRAFT_36616 [Botryobasidium botryosum FD-172 SS1]
MSLKWVRRRPYLFSVTRWTSLCGRVHFDGRDRQTAMQEQEGEDASASASMSALRLEARRCATLDLNNRRLAPGSRFVCHDCKAG